MGIHKEANGQAARLSYSWKHFGLESSQFFQQQASKFTDANDSLIAAGFPYISQELECYGIKSRAFNYSGGVLHKGVTVSYEGSCHPRTDSRSGGQWKQKKSVSLDNRRSSNEVAPHVDTIPLTLALQRSLDIEFQMIVLFSELLNHFDVEGVGYQNRSLDIEYGEAPEVSYRCCYGLSLVEEKLGTIEIYRIEPFNESQLEIIEHILSALIYPLKNALEYRRALQQAHSDPLTGISNRKLMDHVLQSELSRSQRYGVPLSMLMIDIDHFKSVNDHSGHRTGDLVLKKVSQCIQDYIRESDYLFRYGGDEFVVILTDSDISAATTVAERIRHCIAATAITERGAKVEITLSIGIAELTDDDVPESLFERADSALYRAKQKGRNRTVSQCASDYICKED